MTQVINFVGGPSAGKSTMAAQLFGWMKQNRMNVEYVSEFAKDLTWDKALPVLDDQLYVFAEQNRRLYRLLGQVDYIITDSPLFLSLYYVNHGMTKISSDEQAHVAAHWRVAFEDLVTTTWFLYNNKTYNVIRGNRKFIQAGRNQTEAQSKEIDTELISLMDSLLIGYKDIEYLIDVLVDLGFCTMEEE